MKNASPLLPLALLALSACSSSDNDDGRGSDPTGFPELPAQVVSDGLAASAFGAVTSRKVGALPPASTVAGSPMITQTPMEAEARSAATIPVNFIFVGERLKGILVKVRGANDFQELLFNDPQARAKNNAERFDLTLPDDLPVGRFCVDYAVMDLQDRVSPPAEACFRRPSDAGLSNNVISRLRANAWVGPCERFGNNFSGFGRLNFITDDRVFEEFREFNNGNCSGTPESLETVTYGYQVGIEEISGDGTRVNRFDYTVLGSNNPFENPVGTTFFDIILVGGGQLVFGFDNPDQRPTDPAERPTRLNFQTRFTPSN